jgi:hypothetical protein
VRTLPYKRSHRALLYYCVIPADERLLSSKVAGGIRFEGEGDHTGADISEPGRTCSTAQRAGVGGGAKKGDETTLLGEGCGDLYLGANSRA